MSDTDELKLASELIRELKRLIKDHGDMPVYVENSDYAQDFPIKFVMFCDVEKEEEHSFARIVIA